LVMIYTVIRRERVRERVSVCERVPVSVRY
jgi:hypothetical protein